MCFSPRSSVFPLFAFSSVYTSAVIYLLFCGSNVVNMCLASLHAPLICSQVRNHWRTIVDLPSSLSFIPQWILTTRMDRWISKNLLGCAHEHVHVHVRLPLIVSHFWPIVLFWLHNQAFFFSSLLGQWEQQEEDRHHDLQELEYLRGVFGLPKPMDFHYPDLWTFNLNVI